MLISPSCLKYTFAEYQNLGWKLFFSQYVQDDLPEINVILEMNGCQIYFSGDEPFFFVSKFACNFFLVFDFQ